LFFSFLIVCLVKRDPFLTFILFFFIGDLLLSSVSRHRAIEDRPSPPLPPLSSTRQAEPGLDFFPLLHVGGGKPQKYIGFFFSPPPFRASLPKVAPRRYRDKRASLIFPLPFLFFLLAFGLWPAFFFFPFFYWAKMSNGDFFFPRRDRSSDTDPSLLLSSCRNTSPLSSFPENALKILNGILVFTRARPQPLLPSPFLSP